MPPDDQYYSATLCMSHAMLNLSPLVSNDSFNLNVSLMVTSVNWPLLPFPTHHHRAS